MIGGVKFGHCSLSHAAPSVWNSPPHEKKHIEETTAVRTALKTRLLVSSNPTSSSSIGTPSTFRVVVVNYLI